MVEQSQAYQGEEVASYLFHAYGTNLQFAPGEFNFVKTRAQHGTKEAFRLRDEHFHVPEPRVRWSAYRWQYSICYFCNVAVCRKADHRSFESSRFQHGHTRHRRCRPTAIGRSFKGTLVNTPPETLITTIFPRWSAGRASTRRTSTTSSSPNRITVAAIWPATRPTRAGLQHVPGQSVNRHCAGSLTAIGNAVGPDRLRHGARADRRRCAVAVDDAADELADPRPRAEVRGAVDAADPRRDAGRALRRTCRSPSGWNTAQSVGITREEMDAWAARSHERAIAAIDAGKFLDEIIPLKVELPDGSVIDFSVDEHPAPRTPRWRSSPASRCCTPRSRASRSPRATAAAPTTPARRSRSSTADYAAAAEPDA